MIKWIRLFDTGLYTLSLDPTRRVRIILYYNYLTLKLDGGGEKDGDLFPAPLRILWSLVFYVPILNLIFQRRVRLELNDEWAWKEMRPFVCLSSSQTLIHGILLTFTWPSACLLGELKLNLLSPDIIWIYEPKIQIYAKTVRGNCKTGLFCGLWFILKSQE
jgi:hypothetical protein